MNRREAYSNLKSIDEVRLERLRLGDKTEAAGQRLSEDVARIGGLFTLEGMVNAVYSQISNIRSAFDVARSGYNLVVSLIQKYKEAKR